MKLSVFTLFLSVVFLRGQGTLVYDQQSTTLIEGSAPWRLTPMGQAFTPSLSSIDFVALEIFDATPLNQLGSTLYVNLRADSINGTILGTSVFVSTPDNFFGIAVFVSGYSKPAKDGQMKTGHFEGGIVQRGDSRTDAR